MKLNSSLLSVRLWISAACAATLLVLTGCASIPTDGQVGTITVDEDSRAQTRVDAEGPKPGDGPDAIVRGFIKAGAGYNNNFSVARTFLTDTFAAEWDPTSSVKIVQNDTSLDSVTTTVASDSQTVSFDIPVSAALDAQGVYHQSKPNTSVTMEFSLRQVNGQWRISKAPDGLLISGVNFDNLFHSYPLYFYTPDAHYLVPDVRWFLRTASTATDIVSTLLEGPADYMAGAVLTPIPEGTSLNPQSVTISDGQADVGLDASGLDTKTKERIYTQVESSLLGLGSVTSVEVKTRDSDITSGTDVSTKVDVESQAVATSHDHLVNLANNALEPVAQAPALDGGHNPALSMDGMAYAWLSKDNTQLSYFDVSTGQTAQILLGDKLIPPSFDRFGWLWTAEAGGRGLLAVRSTGELAQVQLPFVQGREISGVRVSRDGTRVVVLSNKDGQTRADIVGIVREDDNKPNRVANADPMRIAAGFTNINDVTWAGSQDLAILGSTKPGEDPQPYVVKVTGPVEALGNVSGGVTIAAGNDVTTVRVGTQTGDLFTYTSGSWQRLVNADVRDPAYPG